MDALQAQVNAMQATANAHAQQLAMSGNATTVQAQAAAQQIIQHSEAAMRQQCELNLQQEKLKIQKEAAAEHADLLKGEAAERKRLEEAVRDAEAESKKWQGHAFQVNAQMTAQANEVIQARQQVQTQATTISQQVKSMQEEADASKII